MSVILRKKKLKRGEYSLYLDFYENGKRRYEFLNLKLGKYKDSNKEILKLADSIKAKRLLEIQSGEHGFVSPYKKKLDFVIFFENEVNSRPPDRTSWQCTLKKLTTFTGGRVAFNAINDDWLTRFQVFLLSEIGPLTAHHYYSNVRTALNKAVKQKILLSNPCNGVPNIKKPEIKREFLELAEIELLARTECSSEEVKRAFLFSCFTGLRYSDVIKLKWENVKGEVLEYRQKKTSKLEYLPLSVTAKALLYQGLKDSKIIPHPTRVVFTLPNKIATFHCIKKWVDKAEIKKRVSFHTSRHTFATLSLTAGTDLYTVSKLLGHKNISTTQVYANIIDEKKKEAINRLPNIIISS